MYNKINGKTSLKDGNGSSQRSIVNLVTSNPMITQSCEYESSLLKLYSRSNNIQSGPVENGLFDEKVLRNKMFRYIMAQNHLFSDAESAELYDMLEYCRRCPSTRIPRFSRHEVSSELFQVYSNYVESMRKRLSKIKGRFAITLDEWKSGNGYDFLRVTLHFHNEYFRLENHTIGYEVLDEDTSYTGEMLFKRLERVFDTYGIKDRLISITRDDAGPINGLLDKFSEKMSNGLTGFKLSGDTRCFGHVLNLVSGAILNYTFFKPKKSKDVWAQIKAIENENPEHVRKARKTAHLVFHIVKGVRETTFLGNTFAATVGEKRYSDNQSATPETSLKNNDTRWLSTYKILQRFSYFRDEIELLLNRVRRHLRSKQQGSEEVDAFSMDESDWNYIQTISSILDIFVQPSLLLQGYTYKTANLTIPVVLSIWRKLKDLNNEFMKEHNPLLSLGLLDASKILLEYYPIRDTDIEPLKHLYLATVLDPRIKLDGLRRGFFPPGQSCSDSDSTSEDQISRQILHSINDYFREVYRHYKKEYDEENNSRHPAQKKQKTNNLQGIMKLFLEELMLPEETIVDDSEAQDYLYKDKADIGTTIEEYYMSRKEEYPVIFRMAKDFLSTMAMTAPSDSLLSQEKFVITDRRHRMVPGTVHMAMTLKSEGYFQNQDIDLSDLYVYEDSKPVQLPDFILFVDSEEDSETGKGAFSGINIQLQKTFKDDNDDKDDTYEEEENNMRLEGNPLML